MRGTFGEHLIGGLMKNEDWRTFNLRDLTKNKDWQTFKLVKCDMECGVLRE